MSVVMNASQFLAGLDDAEAEVKIIMRNRVRRLVDEGLRRLLAKTPVNTGEAAMNYVATGGTPYTGPVKQAGDPVEPTNDLPLGAERLRPAAEAVAIATIGTVDFSDPFNVFWITNKAPHIGGLETGSLPQAPYSPRSPAGMFGVTIEELAAMLESGRI
ncbi:hypothetical protein SAMN04488103_102442 [Gemmobacter aquatilis]|uniref:Phage protein, HK97 gp10 family n=1 Tax=Gemmobacter aquatilis TaxID=933059 RepID=A0A1H8C9K6_9RHOB|nr:hypothetical protein [Gemmobacter aquatilis]SEM91911.1 hypothetical protein SAMN04488103_102442 [Gemmobacter aquatilis]